MTGTELVYSIMGLMALGFVISARIVSILR